MAEASSRSPARGVPTDSVPDATSVAGRPAHGIERRGTWPSPAPAPRRVRASTAAGRPARAPSAAPRGTRAGARRTRRRRRWRRGRASPRPGGRCGPRRPAPSPCPPRASAARPGGARRPARDQQDLGPDVAELRRRVEVPRGAPQARDVVGVADGLLGLAPVHEGAGHLARGAELLRPQVAVRGGDAEPRADLPRPRRLPVRPRRPRGDAPVRPPSAIRRTAPMPAPGMTGRPPRARGGSRAGEGRASAGPTDNTSWPESPAAWGRGVPVRSGSARCPGSRRGRSRRRRRSRW